MLSAEWRRIHSDGVTIYNVGLLHGVVVEADGSNDVTLALSWTKKDRDGVSITQDLRLLVDTSLDGFTKPLFPPLPIPIGGNITVSLSGVGGKAWYQGCAMRNLPMYEIRPGDSLVCRFTGQPVGGKNLLSTVTVTPAA